METFISDISKKEFPEEDKVAGSSIRKPIMELIVKDHPGFTDKGNISIEEHNFYREKYISNSLLEEIKELSDLSETVLSSIKDETSLTEKLESDDNRFTFGQRVADKVASFGGSWSFIISFGIFLVIWICTNAFVLATKAFDPYPFILLNLILSCIAAMQAPVIMMSQNRQEEKDRERARKDYMINLKSELEIRMLHEKLDHLIMHQQQELIEIQRVQVDMMNDIMEKISNKKG